MTLRQLAFKFQQADERYWVENPHYWQEQGVLTPKTYIDQYFLAMAKAIRRSIP